jgi:hypothetical protein
MVVDILELMASQPEVLCCISERTPVPAPCWDLTTTILLRYTHEASLQAALIKKLLQRTAREYLPSA